MCQGTTCVAACDRAPADRKAEALGMPESTGGVATQDVSEQELRERQERVSRVLEEERLEKEQQKAALKQQEAEKAVYCERFRNRMERLLEVARRYLAAEALAPGPAEEAGLGGSFVHLGGRAR